MAGGRVGGWVQVRGCCAGAAAGERGGARPSGATGDASHNTTGAVQERGRQGRRGAHRVWRQVSASHSTAAASSPCSQLFMCSMIASWLSSMVRMTKEATVPARARKGCAGSPALQERAGAGKGRLAQRRHV